jgi:hypothetical protein
MIEQPCAATKEDVSVAESQFSPPKQLKQAGHDENVFRTLLHAIRFGKVIDRPGARAMEVLVPFRGE